MSISVIVASYGDREFWEPMSRIAVSSAAKQVPRPEIIRIHGNTLAEARNLGASLSSGDWLCFLDCDDVLEPGYLYAMEESIESIGVPNALFYPLLRRVPRIDAASSEYQAVDLTKDKLWRGNYMVIGTIINSHVFHAVGGFHELPAYEDWDLWLRCVYRAGCTPIKVSGAVYRALIRQDGRNLIPNAFELTKRILAKNGFIIRDAAR